MGLNKFLRRFTRFLLSMILFSIIFIALTDLSLKNNLGYLYDDIYDLADNDAQTNAVTKIRGVCDGLMSDRTDYFVQLRDICNNESKMDEFLENCEEYAILLQTDWTLKNEEVEKSCAIVKQLDCSDANNILYYNSSRLSATCELQTTGALDDKQFFTDFMLGTVNLPKINSERAHDLLIPLIGLAAFILVIYFLLHKHDNEELISGICRMCLRIGILLVIVYSIFFIWMNYFTPDTSNVLLTITGDNYSSNVLKEGFLVLMPIVLSNFFTNKFLITGIIFIVAAIMAFSYLRSIKRKSATNI